MWLAVWSEMAFPEILALNELPDIEFLKEDSLLRLLWATNRGGLVKLVGVGGMEQG